MTSQGMACLVCGWVLPMLYGVAMLRGGGMRKVGGCYKEKHPRHAPTANPNCVCPYGAKLMPSLHPP